MKLRLLFFGALSEAIVPELPNWSADGPMSVASLRARLLEGYPQAADRLRASAVAINQRYADDADVVGDGDEVAFLPPVSGG